MYQIAGKFVGSSKRRTLTLTLFLLCIILILAGGSALASDKSGQPTNTEGATPYTDIASAGPLEHVFLGDELSAQIAYTGDISYQVYPPSTIPGDYGTFIATGGTLYAPDFSSHGGTATASLGSYTIFTPVSQSGVTGTGSGADPYTVVTVVDVGATSLRLTQTDAYVIGAEAYRTSVTVSNMGTASQSLVFYRAMDCYLGGSDFGYGFYDAATGAIACSVNENNAPPDRIEQLLPLTAGSSYYEAFYDDVWEYIATQAAFPNTCECDSEIDNGAGLSWSLTIPAGGQTTISHLTTFSPVGNVPLITSKTADTPTSPTGSTNGYTITINNSNPTDVTVDEIFDILPAGFSYNSGTSTGETTSDPAVSGQTLTWMGPFGVPAGGSIMLHFEVTVSSTAGTYFNNAGGSSTGYTVASTGMTAPINVGGPTDVSLSDMSGGTAVNYNVLALGILLFAGIVAGFALMRRR
jgi:uncharacterized repeat protein (TIGR01451 family)